MKYPFYCNRTVCRIIIIYNERNLSIGIGFCSVLIKGISLIVVSELNRKIDSDCSERGILYILLVV